MFPQGDQTCLAISDITHFLDSDDGEELIAIASTPPMDNLILRIFLPILTILAQLKPLCLVLVPKSEIITNVCLQMVAKNFEKFMENMFFTKFSNNIDYTNSSSHYEETDQYNKWTHWDYLLPIYFKFSLMNITLQVNEYEKLQVNAYGEYQVKNHGELQVNDYRESQAEDCGKTHNDDIEMIPAKKYGLINIKVFHQKIYDHCKEIHEYKHNSFYVKTITLIKLVNINGSLLLQKCWNKHVSSCECVPLCIKGSDTFLARVPKIYVSAAGKHIT